MELQLSVYIKDIVDDYIDVINSIPQCKVITNLQEEIPNLIIFGCENADDGYIIHNEDTEYLYVPQYPCTDFATYKWIMACWPQLNKEDFRWKFERLIQHLLDVQELKLNKIFLDALMNISPNMVWFKDINGKHLLVNDTFRTMLHKDNTDIIGKYHEDIWGVSDEQKKLGKCICTDSDAIVLSLGWAKSFNEKVTLPNNIVKDMYTHKAPLRNKYGQIIGTVGVAEDVTAKKIKEQQLQHAISHDYLTDVYNRYFFMEKLQIYNDMIYTVFFFDLNNFKYINDNYGHAFGDKIIILFATILKEIFADDIVARYGGDEFVVAHLSELNENDISHIITTLNNKLQSIVELDGQLKGISTSIGIALHYPNDSVEQIIAQADTNMYKMKKHKQ